MKMGTKADAAAKQKGNAARKSVPNSEMTKSESSRLRILDSAAYILSQKGYSGTTLADIAKRAKLRISTLYYYFASRDDLILDVLLTGSAHVKEHTMAAVSQMALGASPIDRVCVAVEAHLRYILEISHYTEAAVRNGSQLPEAMRSKVIKEQSEYGHFWQRLIDDALRSDDGATPGERRALRLLLIGALNWTVEWWKPGRSSVDEILHIALLMTRRTLESSLRSPMSTPVVRKRETR